MGCSGSKAAEAKPVAAPEGDYQINLERNGEKMGLNIATMSDNTIKVNAVGAEGLVPAWNAGATEELKVKDGDLIVAVNGVFVDSDAMKKELEQTKLLITLKRAPAPAPAPAAEEPAADAAAPAPAAADDKAAPTADGEPAAATEPAAAEEPAAATEPGAAAEPAAASEPAAEPAVEAAAEPAAAAAEPVVAATPAAADTVQLTEDGEVIVDPPKKNMCC